MKHRLLAIALLIPMSITVLGKLSKEEKSLRLLHLRVQEAQLRDVTGLDRAYLDARQLLQSGPCAEFFGGEAAQEVLDALMLQLQERRISDTRIGFRMYGQFTVHQGQQKKVIYRVFENTEINTAGPFRNAKTFAAEPFVPDVGSFPPNTRTARVLILLHELAHLIQNRPGEWLIPDDGGNIAASRRNTRTVEERCGDQIRSL